jgi:hypothetical protein
VSLLIHDPLRQGVISLSPHILRLLYFSQLNWLCNLHYDWLRDVKASIKREREREKQRERETHRDRDRHLGLDILSCSPRLVRWTACKGCIIRVDSNRHYKYLSWSHGSLAIILSRILSLKSISWRDALPVHLMSFSLKCSVSSGFPCLSHKSCESFSKSLSDWSLLQSRSS